MKDLINAHTLGFLEEPPVKWKQMADTRIVEVQAEVIRELDGLIERAARVRGYLDGRYGGDQGHADAVKQSNALATKIRRALGFAVAKQDLRF